MFGTSRFGAVDDVRRARRRGFEWAALEPRQMLSAGGGAAAALAVTSTSAGQTALFSTNIATNSTSVTALVVAFETSTSAAPLGVYIVPSPIPCSPVVHLEASSAPAVNQIHIGRALALSEEQPPYLTHLGQGPVKHPHLLIPLRDHGGLSRHEAPGIDRAEPVAPQAPVKPAPAAAAPAVAEPPAHPAIPAVPFAIPPDLFEIPDKGSPTPLLELKKGATADPRAAQSPSMGMPVWISLAAAAAGGSRFVWTDRVRAESRWSKPAARRLAQPRRREPTTKS